MKIQGFLSHHGVARNPFAEEDAQTDKVFKEHCIESTYHVGWEKIFGDPSDPATSIVFGEKGAGKTALRMQIDRHVQQYNQRHLARRLFVIHYDDLNPFLDRFREHVGGRVRRADRLLGAWRLWDHMDAILSLGVTDLVNKILTTSADQGDIPPDKPRELPRHLRRDLLLLAACYDQSKDQPPLQRWRMLGRQLKFHQWRAYLPAAAGVGGTLLAISLLIAVLLQRGTNADAEAAGKLAENLGAGIPPWLLWACGIMIVLGWLPWIWKAIRRCWLALRVVRRLRVGSRPRGPLFRILMNFSDQNLVGQPLPNKDRTDDRYELLAKFQNVLEPLGYSGVLVLVDRIDEPHLINGQSELMRALLWPLLDNKFLKHPGVGLKIMLPIELRRYIDRADRDFYQRARLDKQNMIPSLQWTGEALYDLGNARVEACAVDGKKASLRAMFDESVTDQRLIEGFRSLRVPRHLFKFMYRLLVAHCNAHTDDKPVWQITNHMYESMLAVYGRDMEAADQGVGA